MGLIRFSVNNPLLINLTLIILLLLGVLSWRAMPQELFPAIQLDMAYIMTEFEGASPAEVEQQVTITIEEEFKENEDIDYISSTSSEGFSHIYIKLKPGSNVDDFMRDARTLLDRITELPELAEEPELTRIRARFPVISLSLYGKVSNAALFEMAEQVRRRAIQIPGVASVTVAGDREWEIWTIVDPHVLAARRVPLEQVIRALRDNLRDQPGGNIESIEGDIRLRGQGVAPDPAAIEDIVVRVNDNGGKLRLGEIARVERRFEKPLTYARFNGQPSVNLTVTKTAEASTIDVSDRVKALADDLVRTLPASVNVGHHTDMSVYVESRLNTVKSSGLIGLILVLLALCLLLNLRAAAVTSFGIPVSFLVGIILLYYFGYSLNMVSLFAFLIVLGMIVDDAIIVTENVYRHIEDGIQPLKAAVTGAREVMWPVIVSTLTTMAAFLPMFAIGSTLGTFIQVIPVVVTCTLLGSLIEAFMVLPSHAAHLLRKQPRRRRLINWRSLLDRYAVLLHWSALNRYLVTAASAGLLVISITYAQTRLPFEMFGNVEIGQFFVNIETPSTYSLEASLELAERLEDEVLSIVDPDKELGTMLTNVGVSMIDFNRTETGSNLIQLIVDLKQPVPEGFIEHWISPLVNFSYEDFGPRERSAETIINEVRERLVRIPGVKRMSILRPDAGPAGNDIEVGVVSSNLEVIDEQTRAITDYLKQLPGVKDTRNDQEPGKIEYRYVLNEKGRRLGLDQSQVATAVRSGYLGNEVVYVTWDEKRIPVRLIYPESVRTSSISLADLPIVLSSGGTVYLGDVADIEIAREMNDIRRRNNQRMAKITAEVDSEIITPLVVTQQIADRFSPRGGPTDNYSLLFLGEKKDAEESFAGMFQALIIALVVIFFMLTALFRSLLDPIAVMLAIPFGFIGVVFGHALFGYHLQFLSAVGMLALSGIIVNDSLILVDFIKRRRQAGLDRIEAVVEAGRVRARPILLTTITTFLGVSPLIFFATGQTAFLSPMAVSLGFGLIFATGLILLVLPSLYLIFDDLRHLLMRVWRSGWVSET